VTEIKKTKFLTVFNAIYNKTIVYYSFSNIVAVKLDLNV